MAYQLARPAARAAAYAAGRTAKIGNQIPTLASALERARALVPRYGEIIITDIGTGEIGTVGRQWVARWDDSKSRLRTVFSLPEAWADRITVKD